VKKKLTIPKIKDGTVIDHIRRGKGPLVLWILNVDEISDIVSMAMNVPSKKLGKKDIVKIENKELEPEEVNKISLITPEATINYIENFEVVEKYQVELLDTYTGILKCPNENCVTNIRYDLGYKEPIVSKFKLKRREPVLLQCAYCEKYIEEDEIPKYIFFKRKYF